MKTRFCLFFVVALGFAFNTSVTGIDAVITNCGPVAGGFLLEWIPAGEADVLWTPDLVMPFTNLSITLPSGQGSYTDTVHGADNQCYYRVDLYPPEGMVLIPGGMNSGINPLAPGESYDPAERVEYPSNYAWAVSSFYMDQTEVPKGKWDEVYNWATNNSYVFERDALGKAADHPVHTVNTGITV